MKTILSFMLLVLLCALPACVSAAAKHKIQPMDDETFESNFKKGVQESVTLQSGQIVELHEDFTWEYSRLKKASPEKAEENQEEASVDMPDTAEEAVEVWDTTFNDNKVDNDNAVRLYIHYKNNTSKKVVGVSVMIKITNSFGKTLFEASDDDEVSLRPGERMRNDTFFVWKDNPNNTGEPYDKMWQAARNGTGKVSVKVRKVIFEDGTVLTNEKKKTKK